MATPTPNTFFLKSLGIISAALLLGGGLFLMNLRSELTQPKGEIQSSPQPTPSPSARPTSEPELPSDFLQKIMLPSANRDTVRLTNVRSLQAGLECHFSVNGAYPLIMDWADPRKILGDCWLAGANFANQPAGDLVESDGTIYRNNRQVGSYKYTTGQEGNAYTITLQGEKQTLTILSPW